jgi:hypothetical protein
MMPEESDAINIHTSKNDFFPINIGGYDKNVFSMRVCKSACKSACRYDMI